MVIGGKSIEGESNGRPDDADGAEQNRGQQGLLEHTLDVVTAGGFIHGRSDRDELFCRRLAHIFSCVVIDVDYALAPDYAFPVAVHQARAVALWAKAQAASLGCDPEKLLLVGQSAGGNLVANVCMDEVAEPLVKPVGALIAYAPLSGRRCRGITRRIA